MIKYLLIFLLFVGCSSTQNLEQRQNNIIDLNKGEFIENVYRVDSFNIFSLKRIKDNGILTVYIEGDGQAWIDRFTPSANPTPSNPVAFKLALADKSNNVIYMSRPCQYMSSPGCNQAVWTNLQYSDLVLEVYKIIFKEKLINNYNEIHLVGYSGGAAIAIYLASQEDLNIKSIRTIAGNINPDEISKLLNLSGYEKTVNFYSLEEQIQKIFQIHYYGVKDKVIPIDLHFNYLERNSVSKCVNIEPVSASHNEGWSEFWQKNYQLKINC